MKQIKEIINKLIKFNDKVIIIISGPPGTGKTIFSCLYFKDIIHADEYGGQLIKILKEKLKQNKSILILEGVFLTSVFYQMFCPIAKGYNYKMVYILIKSEELECISRAYYRIKTERHMLNKGHRIRNCVKKAIKRMEAYPFKEHKSFFDIGIIISNNYQIKTKKGNFNFIKIDKWSNNLIGFEDIKK